MNNKILSLALAISQVTRSFLIFVLIVLVIIGAILVIDNEALPFLQYDAGSFSFSTEDSSSNSVSLRPNRWFMLITFLRMSLSVLAIILILTEAKKVINSIRTLDTFKKENIRAFRKMAYIFIFLFVIHMISILQTSGGFELKFSLPFNYLFAVLGCFILAEIFKEGNKLMEENNLTI